MKKVLLMVAMAISMASTAQNVHIDNQAHRQYVCIDSIRWIRNMPKAVRLYTWGVFDDGYSSGVIRYQLRDSLYVDQETNNFRVIEEKDVPITGADYEAWDPESKYLFTFIANLLNVTIR